MSDRDIFWVLYQNLPARILCYNNSLIENFYFSMITW